MVMIKPKGKAGKIAQSVLRGKGVKTAPAGERLDKTKLTGPYLQH